MDEERRRRRTARDINWALIAGAGPRPQTPTPPNPAPNGPIKRRKK